MEKSTTKSGLVVILIGVLVLIVCLFISYQQADFITNSVEVEGIVEGTGSSGTGDSKEYSATISYLDAEGITRISRITGSSNIKNLQKGEVLALRYAPDSPDSVVIDSLWELWGTVLILGIIGLTMFIGGVGLVTKSMRK